MGKATSLAQLAGRLLRGVSPAHRSVLEEPGEILPRPKTRPHATHPSRTFLPHPELLESRLVLSGADTVGQWSGVMNWPITPITTFMLPTGRVLMWDDTASQRAVWDPNSNTMTTPSAPSWNTFCGAQAFMADGRIFEAGGHISSHVGFAHAGIYDPFSDTWTQVPDMNKGRWYAINTTLPNGDVLVTGGEVNGVGDENPLPQVWQVSTGSWRNLTGAQLGLPTYPWMFVAPNGKVFDAGPLGSTGYLDTSGTGSWGTAISTNAGDRSAYPAGPGAPESAGSAVMYAPGQILITGGGQNPINSAEVIDLNQSNPTWQYTGSMQYARQNGTATILADGTVLETGGTSGPGWVNTATAVYAAEIWNPATGQWTTMASEAKPRWYHSTALLLPDGRVLTAGGWDPNSGTFGGITNGEIFSPPYLFKGARPTISSAPTQLGYGQTFFVQTPDAASIQKVNFIRLGEATHAFNSDQRNVPLNFTVTSGGLNVTAPGSGNTAPPGYYMLFIVNGNGVPSVAQIIRIGQNQSAPTLTATAVSPSEIDLSWTAVPGATGYVLQGRQSGTTTWGQTNLGAGTTTFQNFGLAAGTKYEYRVLAHTSAGDTAWSALATATTPTGQVPAAPTLTATAVSSSQINLSWTAVPGATGYVLQGRQSGTTTWGQANLGAGTTTFQNTGLAAGTKYEYRVLAHTGAGDTAWSALATATTA